MIIPDPHNNGLTQPEIDTAARLAVAATLEGHEMLRYPEKAIMQATDVILRCMHDWSERVAGFLDTYQLDEARAEAVLLYTQWMMESVPFDLRGHMLEELSFFRGFPNIRGRNHDNNRLSSDPRKNPGYQNPPKVPTIQSVGTGESQLLADTQNIIKTCTDMWDALGIQRDQMNDRDFGLAVTAIYSQSFLHRINGLSERYRKIALDAIGKHIFGASYR